MADATIRGHFVWHDLVTAEPEAATAFYPKFVPWKTKSWDKDGSYTMWLAKSGPIGGIMPLPEAARTSGAKPHWLPYIATPDLDATVAEATKLGGLIITRPTDIANGGRYAVLADPQGAVFAAYSADNVTAPSLPPKPGEFSWHEHAADDYEKAFAFYQQLFGWEKVVEHDMGPLGTYFIFGIDGVAIGGMFNKPPQIPAANWLSYVQVKNAKQATSSAKGAGGEVLHGPAEVPGGDLIAQLLDPQGAAFALHAFKKVSAEKSEPKAAEPAPTPEPTPEPAPVKKKAAKPAAKVAKAKAKPAAKAKSKSKSVAKKAAKAKKAKSTKAPAKAKRAAPAKKAAKKKSGKKKIARSVNSKKVRAASKAKAAARKTAPKKKAKAPKRKK